MPILPLGSSEARRTSQRLPHIRQNNMILEADASNVVDGLVRLQRPGLTPFATVGSGPVHSVWRQDGTFGGDYLVVSGPALYRVTVGGVVRLLGIVNSGRAQIAASATRAIVAIGGAAYSTDGSTVVAVPMPDSRAVGSVAFLSGFFFLSQIDTQRIYYIQPGDTVPGGLDFFEAERTPDPVVSMMPLGDELWIIGSESEEVWGLTGDIDAPAQRFAARAYTHGCINRDTLLNVDGTLAWVTADFDVVLAQGVPAAISSPAIVEDLRKADPSSFRAWFYRLDGHLLYVLTTGLDTFAYDLSSQLWSRFSSYGSNAWRAHTGAALVCGDAIGAALWRLDTARSNDAGENMIRELTGGIEIVGTAQRCNSVSMRVAAGWSPRPDFEPILELKWSDDEGASWSPWRRIGLGKQGEHRAPVAINKLGLMRRPGRFFWLRCSDDAFLRISHVQYNEAKN